MTVPRNRRVSVLGVRTHIAECGEGPPAILAPGLGLSTRFYLPLLEAFGGAGVRLIVPDLPGTGGTRGALLGSSVAASARFLLGLADSLELERPAWIAHSVGCQAALQVAAEHGDRVATLVLATPTGAPGRWRRVRQLLALPRAALAGPFDLVRAVMRDYVRVWPWSYVGTWLRAGSDHPVERLAHVRCPTLVLLGAYDPIVPPALERALLDGIAGARLLRIAGGHGLPRDAVAAFTAAAAGFVRETSPEALSAAPIS